MLNFQELLAGLRGFRGRAPRGKSRTKKVWVWDLVFSWVLGAQP